MHDAQPGCWTSSATSEQARSLHAHKAQQRLWCRLLACRGASKLRAALLTTPATTAGGCGVASPLLRGTSRHLRRLLQQVTHNGRTGNAELGWRLFAASVRIREL